MTRALCASHTHIHFHKDEDHKPRCQKKKKNTATTHPVGGIKYIKKLSVGSPLVFSFECTLKCNVDSLISILLLSLLLSHEILAPNRVWKIKLTVSVTNSSCY